MTVGLLWLIIDIGDRSMAFGASSTMHPLCIAERYRPYYAKESTKVFKYWWICGSGIHNFFLATRTSHHDTIGFCHLSHLLLFSCIGGIFIFDDGICKCKFKYFFFLYNKLLSLIAWAALMITPVKSEMLKSFITFKNSFNLILASSTSVCC